MGVSWIKDGVWKCMFAALSPDGNPFLFLCSLACIVLRAKRPSVLMLNIDNMQMSKQKDFKTCTYIEPR